jgi:hypothetical protein
MNPIKFHLIVRKRRIARAISKPSPFAPMIEKIRKSQRDIIWYKYLQAYHGAAVMKYTVIIRESNTLSPKEFLDKYGWP